jgi:ATP-dependent Clp protease adaptor protein ClpS
VGIEILGLLAASAGASWGWWKLQQRRERRLWDYQRSPELEVVLAVAQHEAQQRLHDYLWPLHLLHGLAQDEDFVAVIGKLDGDAAKLEAFVQDALDRKQERHDEQAMNEGARVVGYTLATARALNRPATTKDLWAQLRRTDVGKAAAAAAGVDATDILFVLAHGMREPSVDLPDRTDVHVIVRNDDHTTYEFVQVVLRDVFELDEQSAAARTSETHHHGAAIVGRYKLAVAKDKVGQARQRAREQGYPLWIGVEDC